MTDNDKVPELTNGEFDDFAKKGIVVIDFFAEWCMPCITMGPIIVELAEKFRGKIKFGKVNVEENQELAEKFEVQSIPHLVVFKDGKPVGNFVGSVSGEELEGKLKGLL